jgi:predicted PurR-regulated permease PerM
MALQRDRIATLVFYGLAALLAYLTFQLFRPFLVPLAWAAVLVICFYPAHARFERRYGRSRAAFLSTLLVTLVIILPMLLVISAFVSEAARHLDNVPRLFATAQARLGDRWWQTFLASIPGATTVDMASLVTNAAQRVTSFVTGQAAAIIQNAVLFVVYLGVTIFTMFFLFRDAPGLMIGIRQVLPIDDDLREQILEQTRALVTASVVSSLIVAAAQGFVGGLAFWALGLGAPVFWGVVMGFFCLLPFGAWIVWGPAAVWLMLTGDMTRGVVLAAVGVGIVSAVDNFLRPVLLSGRSQINGLLLFISLLGGVGAFGVLGLVLGPILMATAVALFKAYVAGLARREALPAGVVPSPSAGSDSAVGS